MDIAQYMHSGSDWYRKEDCTQPLLLTIKDVNPDMVGDEEKLVMSFFEGDKTMVLNRTNLQLLALFFKSTNSADWMNHKIVLYNDPSITFGGKLVGGIRVRLPEQPAAAPQAPAQPYPAGQAPAAPAAAPVKADFNDDVPW